MVNQPPRQGSSATTQGKKVSPTVSSHETTRGTSTDSGQNQQRDPESASTMTSQVQGVLDQQVHKGARVAANVANSARRAADELETESPQLADLVRGMADRLREYSRDLEERSAVDIYESASDFTRRQPALVFGVAAFAGFLALRTLRSRPTRATNSGSHRRRSAQGNEFHGS